MTLQTRVANILTKPNDEWQTIAHEPATVEGLLREYAAPLAAIPAIASFIGLSIVGLPVPLLGTIRYGFGQSLVNAVLTWAFALVGAWVAAVVVEKLAPTFQSSGTTAQALKLVVYAMTPVWVAGVLNLIPVLIPLGIIASLYAIYLFYLGLPRLMATPREKVIPYMVVSALVIIVVSLLLTFITGAIAGIGVASSV
jgi:hypothetical protein